MTMKMLWNSVIRTEGAKYMCIKICNMYLATPMDSFEYMCMPMVLIPEKFAMMNNLYSSEFNGFVIM